VLWLRVQRVELNLQLGRELDARVNPRPAWIMMGCGVGTAGLGLIYELLFGLFDLERAFNGLRPPSGDPYVYGLVAIGAGLFGAAVSGGWALWIRGLNAPVDARIDELRERVGEVEAALDTPPTPPPAATRSFVPFVARVPEPWPL